MIRQQMPIVPAPILKHPIQKPLQPSLLADLAAENSEKSSNTIPTPVAEKKSASAFKTIREAADILGIPAHVLRFWETQFTQIKPTKSRGGRRYYRPEDMEMLVTIKTLLYKEGYTIKGARKALDNLKHDVTLSEQAVLVHKTPLSKPAISDKQKAQLTHLKNDLLILKDQLVSFL